MDEERERDGVGGVTELSRALQPEQVETFIAALRHRGTARLALTVEIRGGSPLVAVACTGSFVVFFDR